MSLLKNVNSIKSALYQRNFTLHSKLGLMFRFLIIFFLLSNVTFAQKSDSLTKRNVNLDSLSKVVKDSVKKVLDTNKVTFSKFVKVVFTNQPSPQRRPALKSTYRSLVLPGWGQATNREYWIIPIIYGGAGVAVWTFSTNQKYYKAFQGVLQQIVDKETPSPVVYKGQTFEYTTSDAQRVTPIVKGFRRNRDLTALGFVVGWALQAVQANVSAHLKSFDMSENISVKFSPDVQAGFGNASAGLKMNISF